MTFSHNFIAWAALSLSIWITVGLALPQNPNVGTTFTEKPISTAEYHKQQGELYTSLDMSGHVTSLPIITSTGTMPLPSLKTPLPSCSPHFSNRPSLGNNLIAVQNNVDPFQPVATKPAPSQIPVRADHPVPRLNIGEQSNPLQTNKFYANLFLGDQSQGVFTHPYTLTWSKGGGPVKSWGMAISQLDYNQKVFGPRSNTLPGHPAQYMINPVGIQHFVLSAAELGTGTILSTNKLEQFSANAVLAASSATCCGCLCSNITFPMTQGMGFVTAVYNKMTPLIQSGLAMTSMTVSTSGNSGIFKYRVATNDGNTWVMYAVPDDKQDPKFVLESLSTIRGQSGFSGIIQIAKIPRSSNAESLYDASAGVYATSATLTGSVNNTLGSYTITWSKAGVTNRKLLMWALPHHVQSFSNATVSSLQRLRMTTTTKGNATAVVADAWTMVESNLPTSLDFAPWNPTTLQSTVNLPRVALSAIASAASTELAQNMEAQTNLNSMYFSGKALAKFASIVYVTKDIVKNSTLALQGLTKLENAFSLFTTNQQQFPLVYDKAWGGVVSSAGYTTHDLGTDFGNTAYNDHHFHWGYFIYAAAVIGYLDPAWLNTNKDWVNSLVRDAANPSSQDNIYPVFRMFDWYHGHSWAHGIFQVADGKDEESSSEDTNFAYAIKLWGKVTGDKSMEARGNLMLSVLARSLNNYFLYQEDNKVMPPEIIGNKVSGILFENKIDHATYFGLNLEYIQGIHMLPILPHSALIRTPTFVQQEWKSFFADGAVDPANQVAGGWRGILYSNLALSDAKSSYAFFSQPNFNTSWLDGGASLTWYLAYAAGRGGV